MIYNPIVYVMCMKNNTTQYYGPHRHTWFAVVHSLLFTAHWWFVARCLFVIIPKATASSPCQQVSERTSSSVPAACNPLSSHFWIYVHVPARLLGSKTMLHPRRCDTHAPCLLLQHNAPSWHGVVIHKEHLPTVSTSVSKMSHMHPHTCMNQPHTNGRDGLEYLRCQHWEDVWVLFAARYSCQIR